MREKDATSKEAKLNAAKQVAKLQDTECEAFIKAFRSFVFQDVHGTLLSVPVTLRMERIVGKACCRWNWTESFGRILAGRLVFNSFVL